MKLENFKKFTLIEKGWSSDKKYCVEDESGKKMLYRVSPIEQYEQKKSEYENMQKIHALGIPMCEPIEFGTCDEGVYSLQGWIEGTDVEDLLPTFSDKEKYDYGYESGQILKKIHGIPVLGEMGDWENFFNGKINRKIENYKNCPLKYENGEGEAFIAFIEANRHLLKNRPVTYQHGDYHVGNMMIDEKGQLRIIDFNRNDYGDPWEEFNRIVWCAQAAPLFATGMVDGYFDGEVPQEFWSLLALYICNNSVSSLPWAIPFGEREIEVMRKQAKDIYDWYDGMKTVVPKWYGKEVV